VLAALSNGSLMLVLIKFETTIYFRKIEKKTYKKFSTSRPSAFLYALAMPASSINARNVA
jgi:hypothetical protein